MLTRRNLLTLTTACLLTFGCAQFPDPAIVPMNLHPGETPQIRALITKYAEIHEIPESLLHRVIQRESGYNPEAQNGPYFGLLQILPQTARGMGYTGSPEGLLDAETNLTYAGKYLKGAWVVARGDETAAVTWYARGYYYEAKRLGLLEQTGLRA